MDILFKNSFTLTEELLLECRVAFTNKWTKFLSIFGLIICLFGLVYFYSESNFNDKIKITTMLFLFIYLLFILPIIKAKKMYKRYLIIHNYKPIPNSINFYDDMFEVFESNGAMVSFSYNNIKRTYNRKNMLVFLCKGDLLVFIKKDGFNQGAYDDFKTFICTKSNLSFSRF